MDEIPPYKIFLIVLLLGIILLGAILYQNRPQNPLESIIEHHTGYIMVGNNSIQAITGPIIKPQTLGSIVSRVLECESNFRHYDSNGNILIGDWNYKYQAYGIAQFQIRTFNWLKGKANKPWLEVYNEDDQIWLLDWAIKNGYGNLWTCYRRI